MNRCSEEIRLFGNSYASRPPFKTVCCLLESINRMIKPLRMSGSSEVKIPRRY